jgi:hypothetical protein
MPSPTVSVVTSTTPADKQAARVPAALSMFTLLSEAKGVLLP